MITLRRGDDGDVTEDSDLRGLHPMIAERMDLWRLSKFALERIPSDHDVYLFRGRSLATTNATSGCSRMAEVRDLTRGARRAGADRGAARARADARRGVRVACAASSRAAAPRERLHWNRVMLYVWPAMEFEPDEARAVIARLRAG